jgi:hypothetical protein
MQASVGQDSSKWPSHGRCSSIWAYIRDINDVLMNFIPEFSSKFVDSLRSLISPVFSRIEVGLASIEENILVNTLDSDTISLILDLWKLTRSSFRSVLVSSETLLTLHTAEIFCGRGMRCSIFMIGKRGCHSENASTPQQKFMIIKISIKFQAQ